MFTLARDPQFTTPVKALVPTTTGTVEQSFTARFLAKPLDELPAWGTLSTEDARTFLSQVLRGWDGVVDDDRQPVPFDQDTKAALLATPWAVWPMVRAYIAGLTPAALGN